MKKVRGDGIGRYLTKAEKNDILKGKKGDFVIKRVISPNFHLFLP